MDLAGWLRDLEQAAQVALWLAIAARESNEENIAD